jgi:hypothetical protein
VWCEKENIADVIYFFEDQQIKYVENLVWVKLDNSENSNLININFTLLI